MKRNLCLFIFFLSIQTLFAQQSNLNERDFALKYKKAVQLYATQQFSEAKNELAPLTLQKYNNAMVPYAHFYHALASSKLQNYFEARVMLRQLFERFPDWEKLEEAYYLYANAAFAENNIDEGMLYLNRIVSNDLKKDIDNLEYHYFNQLNDRDLLKSLNKKYPNNGIIAQILVNNIQKSKNINKEDLEISDNLTNRFNLDENLSKKNSAKRDGNNAIDVAILLPFKINEFDASKINRSNQYVYDFYAGMKLAKEKLETEQITVNLFTFDVERDTKTISELMTNKDFSKIDLLFGPLYPEPNNSLLPFVKVNHLVQVHPFSNNLKLVERESDIFLATPSYEYQANRALDFIKTESLSKVIDIYYGNSKKDSTLGYIYKSMATAKGFTVNVIKKFAGEKDLDLRRKAGHIFIAGSDPSFGGKLINALEKKKVDVPLVGISTAFDFENSALSVFNRALYLIQLDFVNKEKEEVKNFKSLYYSQQNILPSYYSYLGYDLMLFYGRILKYGKENLRLRLNEIEYTQGFTLNGFDFTENANENKIVPIVRYQNGNFYEIVR